MAHHITYSDTSIATTQHLNKFRKSKAAVPTKEEKQKMQMAKRVKLDPKQAKTIPALQKERQAKETSETHELKEKLVKPYRNLAEARAVEDKEDDEKMVVVSDGMCHVDRGVMRYMMCLLTFWLVQ
jgi:hypothetical protein